MIVKNEAHIIERAFESVKCLFDTYIICDTGSTDNTVEVINNWMTSNDKKGEIIYKDIGQIILIMDLKIYCFKFFSGIKIV